MKSIYEGVSRLPIVLVTPKGRPISLVSHFQLTVQEDLCCHPVAIDHSKCLGLLTQKQFSAGEQRLEETKKLQPPVLDSSVSVTTPQANCKHNEQKKLFCSKMENPLCFCLKLPLHVVLCELHKVIFREAHVGIEHISSLCGVSRPYFPG